MRINSGSDDAAGLSIASGMTANIAALTQSTQNANNGVGFLQTADGALAQVNTLLGRAVTLATQSASSGLTGSQRSAANTAYQSILAEINQIGSTTNFNGNGIFSDGTVVALADSGTAITGTVDPTATLSGSVTITTDPPDPVTFTAAADGSSISSSVITTGDTLTGQLVVNSSGGTASDTHALNLTNYQGLSSSNSATATAAANQLAADLTSAMGGTTGSNYSASISGGVLTIQTSHPADSPPPPVGLVFVGATGYISTGFDNAGLYPGATLSGSLALTTSGGAAAGSQTIDFANYQGLTSQDSVARTAALAQLGSDLTASLGSETGSTYTAALSGGILQIISSNTNERFAVNSQAVSETLVLGQQNLELAPSQNGNTLFRGLAGEPAYDTEALQGYTSVFSWPAGVTISGMLNVTATTPQGTGTASLDLSDFTGYSPTWVKNFWLTEAMESDLSPTHEDYDQVYINGTPFGNTLSVTDPYPSSTNFIADNGSTLQFTVYPSGESMAVGSASDVGQTPFGEPPSTSTTLNLNGLTSTNLASSLQSQLGGASGNFIVSYASGALSIGLSSTGTTAGIASVVLSANTVQETIPNNVFTSDGTATGSQALNVTVGALSASSVGTSTAGAGEDLSATDLNSSANAATALTKIGSAINDISYQRGAVGANINRLMATAKDMGTEQTNLQSAVNSIQNADIGKTVADMTQYNILQSTGMVALQQSNQAQQAVLKLVQ